MKTVQPIREINQIRQMESILKSQSTRNYILFELGIYSGRRISDIIKLKVKDLRNQDYFMITEQKTGKIIRLAINPVLKKELAKYFLDKQDDEYIIGSRERTSTITETIRAKDPKTGKMRNEKIKVFNTAPNSPISRVQAYRILDNAAKQIGLTEIGTHSLRKTFGYHLYIQSGKDVTIVQKILGHSSPEVTLRYIGITQDHMDDLVCALSY